MTNQESKKHGPGGAHVGLFGRSSMLCAPEGDTPSGGGGGGGDGGERMFTQAEVEGIVKERVARAKTAATPGTVERITGIEQQLTTLTQLLTERASATPPTARPMPAASTTAPARVDIPSQGGLVDIFKLSPGQIDHLGPIGLREIHERNMTAHRNNSGQPRLPSTKRSNG